MEIHVHVRRRHLLMLALLTAAIVGGVAYAATPDGNGTYTACRSVKTGAVRIIDPSLGAASQLGRCTARESRITWSKGAASVTVRQLPSGNARCPAGGASITGAAGSVAYVCSAAASGGELGTESGVVL